MFIGWWTLRVLLSFYLISISLLIAPGPVATAQPTSGALAALPIVEKQSPVSAGPELPGVVEGKPSTVTDADGAFRFEGLERGTHQLYLDPSTLPADLRPAAGAPRVTLWLNPGQLSVSDLIGWGVRLSAHYDGDGTTISGVVFLDRDGDGQRDLAEAGLASVTVIDPTVHQYFVPFNDDDLWTLFAEINDDGPIGQCLFDSPTSRNLDSFLSVTSSSDGTIFYYDHWEDGYDADPLMPGLTTEVGAIDAGVTQTFNNVVATPRLASTLLYDGRDRITLFGEPASVVRASYPITLGTQSGVQLAGAWEVPEVSDWGRSFVTVIGEDLDFNGAGVADDFDYVGLEIMAAQADTQIWVNGTLVTTTVGAGATFLIDGENNGLGNGGVDSGDVITATGPLQVQMLGAACDVTFSARAYTLQPVGMWDHDYWAPVPDFTESAWCDIDLGMGLGDRDTDLYIHNPHGTPITVLFNEGGGDIPLTVPAHTTISALDTLGRDLDDAIGAHLYSTQTFWGVSAIDSISGNSAIGSTSNVNDWGYSLIPVNRLSSQVVLGWSPGNSLVPPTSDPNHNNGSLAFVSALTDTVVYVDFTQDGLPDAFDINGDSDADDFDVFDNLNFDEPTSDDGIPLAAGQVLRVADPNDNDMTGALIYTRDLGSKIAVAWGQDPCRSERRDPYLDLGYTILPAPIPSLSKTSELFIDADSSNDVSPGDTLRYSILLHNSGLGPLLNGILTDTVPYTYTDFVVGSLAVSQPPPLGSTDYLSVTWGYPPVANAEGVDPAVQAFRLTWPRLESKQTITIAFDVMLENDIPADVTKISNQATFGSDDTGTTLSQDPNDPLDPDTDVCVGQPILQISKIGEPDPVRPGDLLTYTIVATNTGSATALGALFLENLPPYVTYQPGTLNLTLPSVMTEVMTVTVPYTTTFAGSYADDFDLTITETTNYTGSDGSLAWSTDWIEVNDPLGPGPAAGDVRVGSTAGDELSPAGYLELTDSDGSDSSVMRTADLSDFISPALSFYVRGISNAGDTYDVRVNGLSLPGFPQRYNGLYQRRTQDLSAYAGQTNVTLQFVANAAMENTDLYRLDNIVIYEASPLRSRLRTMEETVSVLTYTTQTGIDPVNYDPVANTMTVTNEIRIPSGAQVRFSFQVRVASPLPNGMTLLNTAAISATNVTTTPYPLEDDELTTVLSSHTLELAKSDHSDPIVVGGMLTYTLAYTITGDGVAVGAAITDNLPVPYVSFVRCSGGLSCGETSPGSGVVVWQLGDLPRIGSGITQTTGTVNVTTQVDSMPPGGMLTNSAIIDDRTDTPPDTDDETTSVLDASIALSKQRITPSPIPVGDLAQFLIVITNTGSVTITHLPLEDTYDPTYLQFQNALPSPSVTTTGIITWNDLTEPPGSDLAPGESTQVLVEFVALTNTQQLSPPVTVNTAASDGAATDGVTLPLVEDDADVEIVDRSPVAIELLYLRAEPKAGGVLVEWATLFEIDTYGFWLYRSEDQDLSHAVPVSFVAGKGWLGLGAAYQYLDADLPPGVYHYWLVEVENGGQETTYGPVSARSGWDEADLPHRVYLPVIRRE